MWGVRAWIAVVALSCIVGAKASHTPPHVVFIVADDLGYNDLGCKNGGKTITPAIDALIGEVRVAAQLLPVESAQRSGQRCTLPSPLP